MLRSYICCVAEERRQPWLFTENCLEWMQLTKRDYAGVTWWRDQLWFSVLSQNQSSSSWNTVMSSPSPYSGTWSLLFTDNKPVNLKSGMEELTVSKLLGGVNSSQVLLFWGRSNCSNPKILPVTDWNLSEIPNHQKEWGFAKTYFSVSEMHNKDNFESRNLFIMCQKHAGE